MADVDERFQRFYVDRCAATVGLARLLTGDVHVAEDLTQDAFLKVYRYPTDSAGRWCRDHHDDRGDAGLTEGADLGVGATSAVDAPVALVSEAPLADPSLAVAALRAGPERTTRASRGEHAVLGVITATGYGYVRDDGIAVIPIGTLRA